MEREKPTSRSNPVFLFLAGFAIGVFLSSFAFVAPLVSLCMLVAALGILAAEKIHFGTVGREALFLALFLLSFSLGALRYAAKDFHEAKTPSGEGVVVSEPEDKENAKRFAFKADNGEKVLVSTDLYSPVEYGDRIKITGKLKEPGIIESVDGGRDFDYGAYLAKDDIYWTMSFAKIEIVDKGAGNPVKAALLKIKGSVIAQAKAILPEPQSSLLLGLIIAGRGAMPADILEEFRRAGVIHIVVLSGFNITLIAEFLRRSLSFLFLKLKWVRYPFVPALASIAGVALFVVMTGGEATVVRAALMALAVIVAGLFGRSYSASRALVLAAFLMLLANPKILVFDPSFQLSFLATLGLIFVMPPVERALGFMTERFSLRETLAQTVATQAAVLPLLVYSVGDVSVVSLLANLLVLLVVPWTMLVGFIAVVASYLSAVFAWTLAFMTHLMLSWILFVSHALGSLSFATVAIPYLSIPLIVLYYAGLLTLLNPEKFSSLREKSVALSKRVWHPVERRVRANR